MSDAKSAKSVKPAATATPADLKASKFKAMSQEISRDLIDADPKSNTRGATTPEHVKGLAMSIKREGQLSPIIVQEVKVKDGTRYNVIAGFTRVMAICGPEAVGGLDRPTIICNVLDASVSPLDARYIALAENVARLDITSYALAVQCEGLGKSYNQSGGVIAGRLGKTASYVNNLIRLRTTLAPRLLARWAQECGDMPMPEGASKIRVCTTDWLLRQCKLSHAEQESALDKALGITGEDEEGEDEDEEGEGDGKEDRPANKRATLAALKDAKEAIKAAKGEAKSKEDLAKCEGAIAALDFAMGIRKSIPGLYKP